MSYLMSEHVIRAGPWDLAIRLARILVDFGGFVDSFTVVG